MDEVLDQDDLEAVILHPVEQGTEPGAALDCGSAPDTAGSLNHSTMSKPACFA